MNKALVYTIQELYEKYGKSLKIELVGGKEGLSRKVKKPEVHRPGLSLTGYLKHYSSSRILVFGKIEIGYLRELDSKTRKDRLEAILSLRTPAVIISRDYRPPKELQALCEEYEIPLFCSSMLTMSLVSKLTLLLNEEFSPNEVIPGTLVEVFGVGVLIQGDSSVGKSEAALGLIERGHRLISDDVVKIKKREGSYLVGSGPELTRHMMEIRGIGIINVANLYGAVCVRPEKVLDIVVKLEEWDDRHFYDRIGLGEKICEILGIRIPYHILPVKPGRDVTLLIETISLNHRLKAMGYNSAKEFNAKLLDTIHQRKKEAQKLSS